MSLAKVHPVKTSATAIIAAVSQLSPLSSNRGANSTSHSASGCHSGELV